MNHLIEPKNYFYALELWTLIPEYSFSDFLNKRPLTLHDSEITKVTRVSWQKNGFSIHFQRENDFGSITLPLPESLKNREVQVKFFHQGMILSTVLKELLIKGSFLPCVLSMFAVAFICSNIPLLNNFLIFIVCSFALSLLVGIYWHLRNIPKARDLRIRFFLRFLNLNLLVLTMNYYIEFGPKSYIRYLQAKSQIEMSSKSK
jgi:hypothetical protein